MFNRKAKQIQELTHRLTAATAAAENFQSLANTYWDTAEGLAEDVKNISRERDQWYDFGMRWSKRYDDLASMRPNEARFSAAVEVQKPTPFPESAFRDFIPAIEGLEPLPESFRAIEGHNIVPALSAEPEKIV